MTLPYAEVIGDPISHSKSPAIHGFWIERLGLQARYQPCHVVASDLGSYIAGRAQDPMWRGCNVTIPHKLSIIDHVADPGDVRHSIGAMNTVARDAGGRIFGTNTDAAGFMAPLAEVDLDSAPVAVAGTGGAAHAVLFALARSGAGPVTLLARNPVKGASLLARFGLKGEVKAFGSRLPPVQMLVNATSLGMTGQQELPVDLSTLPDDAIVYDIVYSPIETPLLRQARDFGLATVDGLDMLIGQAALAFELFFGVAPPAECEDELRELLLA